MSYLSLLPEDATPACQERPELFFGPEGEYAQEKFAREEQAKAVCAVCPFRLPCLRYALEAGARDGVWAGLTEDELAVERRRYLREGVAA